jgi:pyridoxine 5-phosphate synthase
MFIEPEIKQIEASAKLGAEMIELHTGAFANAVGAKQTLELERLKTAARQATAFGLQVNAGHGINYSNIALIREVSPLSDLNIGHSIISRALFIGMEAAVREMLTLMNPPQAQQV